LLVWSNSWSIFESASSSNSTSRIGQNSPILQILVRGLVEPPTSTTPIFHCSSWTDVDVVERPLQLVLPLLQLFLPSTECFSNCNIGLVVGVGGTTTSADSTMAVVGQLVVVHPTDLPLVPKHVVLQLNNHDSVGAWRNRSCLIVPTRGPFWTFWISKLDLQNWLKVHGSPIWSS